MRTVDAAPRARSVLVYGAGLVQGLALVSFPAASSILISPTGYDLSTTQYGLMFVPQVVLAITGAATSPLLAARWSLQRVLQVGLVSNLLAMLLLVLSQAVSTSPAAYPVLLCATGALGFGFGTTVPALNTFAARLAPSNQDRSILTLNALLGTGTALAPLLIALFLALGAWWLLPVLAAVGLGVFLVLAVRTTLDAGPNPERTGARQKLPGRFWWYAAAAVLYGVCETLFGNWSSVYLTGERALSAQVASLALAAFWACVTIGRVIVAALTTRVPPTVVFVVLPVLIAATNLAVSSAHSAVVAVLAFAAAGFACSAMLPLNLSLAGEEFPRLGATSSGELIAAYQVGYGVAAFGVAPLESLTGIGLAGIYLVGAGVAVVLAVTARVITAGRPRVAAASAA
ncbi:MFS transporter [Cellulomonas sp. P5_C6]